MDQLAPQHVPVYESSDERERLWKRCADRKTPIVAIRDGRRGFIVRYDLQPLGAELTPEGLRTVRSATERWRPYPTGTDPVSQAECVGGEAGPVSGDLHAPTESDARALASRLSAVVFERTNRQ